MTRLKAVPILIGITAAALLMPARASADDRYRDRDDYRGYYNGYYGDRHTGHEWREHRRHEEHEWREHERREHEWRERDWRPSRNEYRGGYYDQFGYWHSYRY